jgi:hypothetical protein
LLVPAGLAEVGAHATAFLGNAREFRVPLDNVARGTEAVDEEALVAVLGET